MSDLTPDDLIKVISDFEREYRITSVAHKPSELKGMDAERLNRIRELYSEAISLCMIERRTL